MSSSPPVSSSASVEASSASVPATGDDPGALPARGLAKWFTEEVQPHETHLRNYLRGVFPAVRDVDDIVQESYLRIWKARAGRPIQSTKAFLFRIARHLAVDVVRRRDSSRTESVGDLATLPVSDDVPGPAELLTRAEKVGLLADALAHMPIRCREVVILRKFKDVSLKEISAQLRISERTVESHINRGMRFLEAYLRERGVVHYRRDEH